MAKAREQAGKQARGEKERGLRKKVKRRVRDGKGEEDGPVAGSAGVCVGFRVSLGVGILHHVGEVGVR